MKPVLAGAGSAMASAQAVGSAQGDPFGVLLQYLALGSAQPCDGVMLDACFPIGGVSAVQAAPVADTSTGSADLASVIGTYGELIGWMQGGSSSRPYCGGMCPIG
ncbi:hypothetical protein [Nocardia salmonicida]|uniref:hypothetical protein n=1 Tax=Nocardia salmonicida TaxID=53431 RepID=UPI0036333723